MHGWEQAPYPTKADTDASYKRCLDWVLRPRPAAARCGSASAATTCSTWRGLRCSPGSGASRHGSGSRCSRAWPRRRPASSATTLGCLLLYTPVVDPDDFDVAISYLFRRLEENAAVGNFMRALVRPRAWLGRLRRSRPRRSAVRSPTGSTSRPSRGGRIDRSRPPEPVGLGPFANEPESDPAVAGTRDWALEHLARRPDDVRAPLVTDAAEVDRIIERARAAAGRVVGASGRGPPGRAPGGG